MAKNTKRAAVRPWTKNGKAKAEPKEGLRIMSGQEAIKESGMEAAQARKDFKPPQVPPLPGMTPLGIKPAEVKATAAEAKLAKADRPLSRRAQIAADAEAAKLPPAPDWSKRTHYRAQYAELVALVKEGNVRALEKLELPTTITQLSHYRDLAVIALKAKKNGKPAQAARMSAARRYAR